MEEGGNAARHDPISFTDSWGVWVSVLSAQPMPGGRA